MTTQTARAASAPARRDGAVRRDRDRPALRPPLKWAGGKRWLASRLQPLWNPHRDRRLVEPFCGGLSISLSLTPSAALLNDLNPHVINFYRWLQRGLTISTPFRNTSKTYYALRARFNALLESSGAETAEAAGLFYYLNRTGYNGLCRFNRTGRFNVPFGQYKKIDYRRRFDEYGGAFARFEFISVDFEAIPLRPDDFVYADPPYDVEFRQYSPQRFEWSEQVRTATWLARHPGPVVLSNQATPRIVELYGDLGYAVDFLSGPRLISCTGDRTPAREVLATRNL